MSQLEEKRPQESQLDGPMPQQQSINLCHVTMLATVAERCASDGRLALLEGMAGRQSRCKREELGCARGYVPGAALKPFKLCATLVPRRRIVVHIPRRCNGSEIGQKMLLELAVCPVCRAEHELVPQDVKRKRLGVCRRAIILGMDLDAKRGPFFGYYFEAPFARDHVENKLAVSDDDALNAHTSRATASDNLGLSPHELGAGQFGGCLGTAAVDIAAQHFSCVPLPQVMQRLVDVELLALPGNVVEAEPSALARRERFGAQLAVGLFLIARPPAGGACAQRGGRWRGRLQMEGPVLDLVVEDAVHAVGGVRSGKQLLGDLLRGRRRHGAGLVGSCVVKKQEPRWLVNEALNGRW